MNKKFIAFAIFIFALFFVTSTTHAEDEETTTVPTSTIGSINGPADVGDTTETTIFENHCYDIGNGIGQDDFFQDCELPTTTVVEVGEPPIPDCGECANKLPATGIQTTIGLTIVAIAFLLFGGLLVAIALRRPKIWDY